MFEMIAERLSCMVQIPTVSGQGNEAQYQIREYREYLRKEFHYLFGKAEQYPIGEAVLLYLKGNAQSEKLPVLFTGHMDVVPADATSWRYEPFSGAVVGDCIWGRGTQDMKGPQCALLSAFDALIEEGWEADRDIWLFLSCDEESGGETTVRAANWLRDRGVHFETVFDEGGTICEDYLGLMQGKAAMFGISEKGSLEYRFTACSEGGHAANPPANSAIARLAGLIQEAESGELFVQKMSAGNRAMLIAMDDALQGDVSSQLRNAANEDAPYPQLHKLTEEAPGMLGATIAFTMIKGGSAFNVMPKRVELTANVRVSSIETEAEVSKKLQALADRYDVICELIGGTDAAPEGSTDASGYLAMQSSVQEIYPGLPVIPFVLGGATDSRHFLNLTDQVLRFSPMHATRDQGCGVHGDNESATVKDVQNAARCYYVLLKKYL